MKELLAQGCDTADTYSWSSLWQTLSGPAQFKMDLHSFQIHSLIIVTSSQSVRVGGGHWFCWFFLILN